MSRVTGEGVAVNFKVINDFDTLMDLTIPLDGKTQSSGPIVYEIEAKSPGDTCR